ncbi:hypothetical protein GH714_009982 [Hevea brasiliensis]|uniref:Uncharacterized protein n=1 Tax=Hevea brasiliensis TaxID=3981 RepID=A0A6A6KD51_HEVBR|nr:hypothetical protein GH714_009982 [Hevea brasiliensis]
MEDAPVGWVINKLDSLLTGEVRLLRDVHKEFENVKYELETIKSFLKDADARLDQENVDSRIRTWVKQMREVAFRIEDVIDEYMFHVARYQNQHDYLHKMACCVKNLMSRHKIASKIRAIKKSVGEIRERMEKYGVNFLSEHGNSKRQNTWHDPRIASLFIEEAQLVGIEPPKADLIRLLVQGESKNTVISVVGMGGLGKTTLAEEDSSVNCGRLIRLWIAEGFIKERQGVTLEEIAEEYLIDLFDRSLFQVARVSIDGKAKECKVHDLEKSDDIQFKIPAENEGSPTIRQQATPPNTPSPFSSTSPSTTSSSSSNSSASEAFVSSSEPSYVPFTTESSSNFQTHSIIVLGVDELPKSLISSFITNLKLLRALDFEGAPLDHIPRELGSLWHLRYLSLRKTKVKMLPTSIGKLCNLETLELRYSLVYDLPVEINRLLKLRHLLAFSFNYDDEWNLNIYCGVKMHGNIVYLKPLQQLKYIEVDDGMGLISQVERLTQLRSLGIKNLKREKGKALCCALEKMTCLQALDVSSIDEEEFLDLDSMSNPLPLLQRLYLTGPLVQLPHWISKQTSLVKIILNWSRLGDGAIQALQSLPNLLLLEFYEGYNGDQLHFTRGCFQKLKVLHLRSMTPLNVLIIDQGSLTLLEELIIGPCPNLKEMPSGIHFLRNLKSVIFFDLKREFAIGMLPDGGLDYRQVENIPTVLFCYKIKGIYYDYYKLGDSDLVKHLKETWNHLRSEVLTAPLTVQVISVDGAELLI